METQRQERINKLIQALKVTDKIHLKEASAILNVSEMTVRRDLNSEPTSLVVLGGYVVNDPRNNNHIAKYFISDQQDKHVNEKCHVARVAAQLVMENDTAFFDCGTTMPFVIDAIADDLTFTAVCYSLNVFLSLQNKPNCKVILCGGNYNAKNAIFTGISQHSELDYVCPNKAFISAAGVNIQQGATCYHFDELSMKRQAIAMSEQKILVVDHTKFNKAKPAFIGSLALFNQLVTNKKPDSHFGEFFNKNNIKVLY